MTARRSNSGWGAESVPVSVRVGACKCRDAHCPDAAAPSQPNQNDAGHAGQGGSVGGGPAANDESTQPPICTSGLAALQGDGSAAFELTVGQGCEQRSPQRLDCTLDSNGQATFGVVGHALGDALSLSGYLPVCITPNEIGDDGWSVELQKLIAVIPRFGTSSVAIATVRLDDGTSSPVANGGSCDNLITCDELRPLASFQIGVVSRDIPQNGVRREDFRPVNHDVSVTARLNVLKSGNTTVRAYLSEHPDCSAMTPSGSGGAAGGAGQSAGGAGGAAGASPRTGAQLTLSIGAGQQSTPVFYLCAPSYGSSFEITPLLQDTPDSAVIYSTDVSIDAAVSSYSAESVGGKEVLFVRKCGEPAVRAPLGSVPIQDRLSSDDSEIVIDCGVGDAGADGSSSATPDGSAGAAGAGAAGSGGASPTPSGSGAATCEPLTLQLSPEGTCTLNIGN